MIICHLFYTFKCTVYLAALYHIIAPVINQVLCMCMVTDHFYCCVSSHRDWKGKCIKRNKLCATTI